MAFPHIWVNLSSADKDNPLKQDGKQSRHRILKFMNRVPIHQGAHHCLPATRHDITYNNLFEPLILKNIEGIAIT
jgi:hypothetical protein